MMRRRRHLRRGYALPAVLLFLVFAFGTWMVFFRSSASLLRIEQARIQRETRDLWTAPAMATALRLLQTGDPPTDPYTCKLEMTQDGVTKYFLLSYERISPTRWSISAAPTTSDEVAVDAPATFAIPPNDGSGLLVVPYSNTRIDLTWTNLDNETGYHIERSPNGTTGWTEIANTAADVTAYSNTGLTSQTTYYYRVRASNGAGYGGYSDIESTATLSNIPAAPTNLTLTVLGASSIKLDWSDNSHIETSYQIERSNNGNGGWQNIQTTGADATTFTNTGLNHNNSYYYRVRATNSFGSSGWSNVETATTDN